ncbi:MAG: FHA domain-containing protein [Planctomycetota bacterium]
MKLKVLAGAKKGAEIPLKKSKFVVGRASDCTLRAGSEAISRRHCVFLRRGETLSVLDLGSRNGTYVNGARIEGETTLKNGDNIRIGPLEFLLDGVPAMAQPLPAAGQPHGAAASGERGGAAASAEGARPKRPKVQDVADALGRTAANSDSATIEEDDISNWLLGPDPAAAAALKETQTLRMDETHAIAKATGGLTNPAGGEAEGDAAGGAGGPEGEEAEDAQSDAEGELGSDEAPAGKKRGKPEPGKLPKLPPKPMAKDSREAAADILRELARRR